MLYPILLIQISLVFFKLGEAASISKETSAFFYMYEGCRAGATQSCKALAKVNPISAFGHVGVSFDQDYQCQNNKQLKANRIYGFAPADLKSFDTRTNPVVKGRVSDHTDIFKINGFKECDETKDKKPPMTLLKSEAKPKQGTTMREVQEELCKQLDHFSLPLRYSFPPAFGGDKNFYKETDTFNCMTWPTKLGLQLKGYMKSGVVPAAIHPDMDIWEDYPRDSKNLVFQQLDDRDEEMFKAPNSCSLLFAQHMA